MHSLPIFRSPALMSRKCECRGLCVFGLQSVDLQYGMKATLQGENSSHASSRRQVQANLPDSECETTLPMLRCPRSFPLARETFGPDERLGQNRPLYIICGNASQ